jgi:hypothetical protein
LIIETWVFSLIINLRVDRQKTEDLPIMVKVGAVGRYGESHPPPHDQATETIEDWPPWFDLSTKPSKDWPPRLDPSTEPIEECPPFREHVQWIQIAKVMETLGNYLLENQLSEEQPCCQENSRTSFMLEGVPDVRQDFHLVPEMPLLPRGSDVTSELWPNELIHGQLCRWHRVDMRKAICRHWKYKRKKMSRPRPK